jgi:hypothetical protein
MVTVGCFIELYRFHEFAASLLIKHGVRNKLSQAEIIGYRHKNHTLMIAVTLKFGECWP